VLRGFAAWNTQYAPRAHEGLEGRGWLLRSGPERLKILGVFSQSKANGVVDKRRGRARACVVSIEVAFGSTYPTLRRSDENLFLGSIFTILADSADVVLMAKVRAWSMAIAVAVGAGVVGLGTPEVHAVELPEPPVGGPGPEGDYLRLIHERLHPGWVDGFIRISSYKQLGPSTSQQQTEVSIVLRWDGSVESAEVTKASGTPEFDAAALNAVWFAAPFPPPVNAMADDGLAHIKWHFARNYRLCSEAEMVHVEYPLQIALPNLASRGALSEAVRRMSDDLYHRGWKDDFLSPFIRQWLHRSNLSSELDARAAAALAIGGDRQQVRFLETALLLPQTAVVAGPALDRLGVDVGALLAKALASDTADASRPAVLAALRATPAVAVHCATCLEALAAAVVDPRQPARARVEMIEILGNSDSTEIVSQALAHAAKDANVAVRGAALLAQMPRGRGRVGVIRMAPLLHDPLPEIRAAAAAGVLRAGGDLGIEQLFLLGRERDPRPLIAAAAEMGRMSSEASFALLKRLLKRPEKTVRAAVVSALVARHDPAAREIVDPILNDARANPAEDAPVREIAVAGASPAELVGMSTDARLGLTVYRAMLRAELRQESAQWLLRNIEQLSPEDRITAFGAWIAAPPKPVTAATTAQQ
jgi:TonB family protein